MTTYRSKDIKTVKASELIAEVKKLGEEFPDKKAGCRYFDGPGQPCCIVGHALHRLGFDSAEEGTSAPDLSVLEDDGSDTNWLFWVQHYQDCDFTWGEAIERASHRDI